MIDNPDMQVQTVAKAVDDAAIISNEKYSVRQFSPNSFGGYIGDTVGFLLPVRSDLLPAYGTFDCDLALRVLHYTQFNGLWGGASKIWIQKFLGTPFEISGGRNLTYKWQDLFFEAEFGQGYDRLMDPALQDYLSLNRGLFLEKVSFGESDTPIREGAQILGLNHLDAMRIYFTGNREYPYLYASEWTGQLHKMHYTRVIHMAQAPSPNTRLFGIGRSSLYDALTVAGSQIKLGRHQNELLSDLPPSGVVLFTNIKSEDVKNAMEQFQFDRIRDGQQIYRAPLQLNSKDPEHPATVQFIPMATVPEGFDYEKYLATHVNLLALALQLDPQDIWPLQSVAMGSGQQSKILEMKSDSKGPGYALTLFEREWNKVLPRSLEWKYKAQNNAQDSQIAATAQTWITTLNTASFLNNDEKRGIAASQIPAFADELMDENGVVRLYDADPKEPAQVLIAPDTVQLDTPGTTDDTNATSQAQAAPTTGTPQPEVAAQKGYAWRTNGVVWWLAKTVQKDIDATGNAYTEEIAAAISDGVDRTISKATCAARIRGVITRYGKKAYQDGLEEGGVDPDELDEDDLRIIADDNVRDSQYVTNLVNEIYSEAGLSGDIATRAGLWISTLNRFYYDGIASADKNGMYEFAGDDGIENCDTCKALKGQVHRMKEWVNRELRPGVDHHNFDCGTWEPNCSHYLRKTTGKSRGDWV